MLKYRNMCYTSRDDRYKNMVHPFYKRSFYGVDYIPLY